MRKSLDHNLTDTIVTSDEWDNFDYNLRLQIEELADIDYDNKLEKWKENTLASGYLNYAERLLRETGVIDDYTLNSIRELKKEIMEYRNMKTLLLTLRLVTITLRAGIIPEMAHYGENYRKAQSRKSSTKRTTRGLTPNERQKRNERIVEHWKQVSNKGLKLNSFAQKHVKTYKIGTTQIKKIIQKSS